MWGRSGSSLASFDNSMGSWWIRPKQAIPKPQTPYPHFDPRTDIRKKSSRDSPPPTPKQQRAHPKVRFAQRCDGRPFFFCLAQVLSSRHSDGTYCTARQKKRQPSLWATDRPCLDWKDFDGAKQGGGCCTEKLVSPGQPLWLSIPARKFPITPHLLPLLIFFSPSLVLNKPPSWVKGTGFYMKVWVWYLRVLFSWLT